MNVRIEIFAFIASLVMLCGCERAVTERHSAMSKEAAVGIALVKMREEMTPEYVEKYKPYQAELTDGLWHVFGTSPGGGPGGTPEATVRDSNGEVLSVTHGQ